jgi:tetratricopeptide (TPR) repeat protein
MGGVFAFSLLVGLAGAYVLFKDRGETLAPTVAVASDDAAPAIAVMPFSVRGEGLELWREGMVDALSANLEGAGGLRTIASQTILARWEELGGGDEATDLSSQLDVARATGARYTLTGSVISTGSNLRLSADVYDSASGEPLGHGQVEGAPDSMFVLVDRLSIAVLREMLSDEELRTSAMSLAAVTTPSLDALKAYLEAEAHYRRGDFESAVPAYERAIEADSTFAMANYRLENSYGWLTSTFNPLVAEAADRAARYAHRLPDRQAVLVRASQSMSLGTLDGIDALRDAVRRHPDDAEAWFQLADTYFHLGRHLPVGLDEAEGALQRAIELAPRFVPYQLHWYDLAAWLHADSALAAERLSALQELAGSYDDVNQRTLAFEIVFGDSATQRAAIERTDMLDGPTRSSITTAGLRNPRFIAQDISLQRRFIESSPPERRPGMRAGLVANRLALGQGKVSEAVDLVSQSGWPGAGQFCSLARFYAVGLPVPEDRLASLEADLEPGESAACVAVWRGMQDGDGDDWTEALRQSIGELASLADSVRADTASLPSDLRREARARRFDARIGELEGFGLWRQGEPQEAIRVLREATLNGGSWLTRWWIAQIYLELGQPAQALRYLDSLYWEQASLARYHLGKIYDGMGETDRARDAYETFVIAWAEADPELQPLVEEARQAIVRLMDAPQPAPAETDEAEAGN